MPSARSLENLKKNPMPRLGDKPLASRPLSVKVPPDIDKAVRKLSNPSDWLRKAIIEKLERSKGESKAATIDNPLVREAIAEHIANKKAAVAAEKNRLSKANQSLIDQREREIKQLKQMMK
ncbi:MAG: hypothetical protein AB4426_12570 [Xenococcaceae cyanobacterium]